MSKEIEVFQVEFQYVGCKKPAIAGIYRSRKRAESFIALMKLYAKLPFQFINITPIKYGKKKDKDKERRDWEDEE